MTSTAEDDKVLPVRQRCLFLWHAENADAGVVAALLLEENAVKQLRAAKQTRGRTP